MSTLAKGPLKLVGFGSPSPNPFKILLRRKEIADPLSVTELLTSGSSFGMKGVMRQTSGA